MVVERIDETTWDIYDGEELAASIVIADQVDMVVNDYSNVRLSISTNAQYNDVKLHEDGSPCVTIEVVTTRPTVIVGNF